MNKEDITVMARFVGNNDLFDSMQIDFLERFAALAAHRERMACAKDASDKIKYRIKQGFPEHGHAEAVKNVILKRGAP